RFLRRHGCRNLARHADEGHNMGMGRTRAHWGATVLAVALMLGGCASETERTATEQTNDNAPKAASEKRAESKRQDGDAGSKAKKANRSNAKNSNTKTPRPAAKPKATKKPQPTPKPTPKPAPKPKKTARTYYVARVIDGDTVELGNGQGVRVVGIDTPERGECGFDTATAAMIRLVEGKQVRLSQPDEDTDRYGRLLRYLNIGDIDPGLRLIKNGLAIARYDSRDGYGYHPGEPVYIAADKASATKKCAAPAPQQQAQAPAPKKASGNCASGYSPCIPSFPPDVNCADVNGPINVSGTDPHGLDADGDGVACE
ncbi:MAG: thermonuclease family protein, partial [Ornithinimicrobium sp.]